MSATSVKYLHSAMPGAPALTGAAGSLVATLDACLVNGWGTVTLDSLVVADGIATATISTGHSHVVDSVALIEGATPSELNGEKRILSASTNQFTFAADGVADGTATGTITTKVVPLGWVKAFSGTNKAAYKASSVEATGFYLQVTDTTTLSARVAGYEAMSGVDLGTGRFPSEEQFTGGIYWSKAHNTSGTRSWWLIGDDRAFYLVVIPNTSYSTRSQVVGFGDFVPVSSTDAYACFLSGMGADVSTATNNNGCLSVRFADGFGTSASATGYTSVAVAREASGVGGAAPHGRGAMGVGTGVAGSGTSGYVGASIAYPNPADQSLILLPVYLFGLTSGVRGVLPGLFHTPNTFAAEVHFLHGSVVNGHGSFSGQRRVAMRPGHQSAQNCVFFDHIGPWR